MEDSDLPAGLTTSPTSADVAEKIGMMRSHEPPADEPLALVKRKIKIEPGLEEEYESDENQYDMPMDFGEALKNEDIKEPSMAQQIVIAAQTSDEQAIYLSANGRSRVPDLKELIPSAVNGKYVRPFKAYNANRQLLGDLSASNASSRLAGDVSAVPVALSGPNGAAVPLSVPTVPTSTSAIQTASNGGPTHAHLMTLATEADKLLQKTKSPKTHHHNGHIKVENGSSDEAMTPGSISAGSDDTGSAGDLLETTIEKIKKRAALASSPISVEPKHAVQLNPIKKELPRIAPKPSSHTTSKSKSKKDRSSPREDHSSKDQHYWERRRKNNEAAKRSRDARRAKEDQIAIRAALLEQENMRLRIEVAALKEETVKLRAALYNKNK